MHRSDSGPSGFRPVSIQPPYFVNTYFVTADTLNTYTINMPPVAANTAPVL